VELTTRPKPGPLWKQAHSCSPTQKREKGSQPFKGQQSTNQIGRPYFNGKGGKGKKASNSTKGKKRAHHCQQQNPGWGGVCYYPRESRSQTDEKPGEGPAGKKAATERGTRFIPQKRLREEGSPSMRKGESCPGKRFTFFQSFNQTWGPG